MEYGFALAFFVGIVIGWAIIRSRFPKSLVLTRFEYWIYIPESKPIQMQRLMDAMVGKNPYNSPSRPCITQREAHLFSDIRLHLAVVLRTKNPSLFRPDLFRSSVELSSEGLRQISGSQALIKISYSAEKVSNDRRLLQFMPHLAAAVAREMNGLAVFDTIMEQVWTWDEFNQLVNETPNMERIDRHLRIVRIPSADGMIFATRGLQKLGLPELESEDIPEDERQNVTAIFEETIASLWQEPELKPQWDVEILGAKFQVVLAKRRLGEAQVRIRRNLKPS